MKNRTVVMDYDYINVVWKDLVKAHKTENMYYNI
jgi:hypothetical protein